MTFRLMVSAALAIAGVALGTGRANAAANDPLVGVEVMPRMTPAIRQMGLRSTSFPWTVDAVRSQQVRILGNYWLNVADVVPVAEAADYYSQLIARDPRNVWAYACRGAAHQLNNHWQAALADFDAVLRLDSNRQPAYYNRGRSRFQLADLDGALADFNTALQLDPNCGPAYLSRGKTWRAQGKLDAAIDDLNQAIRLMPNNATAFAERGAAWVAQKDFDRALTDYRRALELDPQRADLHAELSRLLASTVD